MIDGWFEACTDLRQLALQWLTARDGTPEQVAIGERFAADLLRWTREHRDAIHAVLRSAPADGVIALQTLGRIAFRSLVEDLVRDQDKLQRLRHTSSRLLAGFPGLREEADRSDLYQSAITKLLKRVETSWPDFSDTHHLDAYLDQVVYRLLIDLSRRSKWRRHITVDGDGELLERAESRELPPDVGVMGHDLVRRHVHARSELEIRLRGVKPDALRIVCSLRLRHGIPLPELAQHWQDLAGADDPPISLEARRKRIERRCEELKAGLDDTGAVSDGDPRAG